MIETKGKNELEKLFDFSGLTIIGYEENVRHNGDIEVVFNAEKIDKKRVCCPRCDSLNTYSKGTTTRTIKDLPMFGKFVTVVVNLKRYKCNKCGKSYQEDIDDYVDKGSAISKRLKEALARTSAVYGFQEAANRYDVTIQTAKNMFSDWSNHLDNIRKPLEAPKALGIDEAHLSSKMRGVFIDVEKGTLLEITPDKKTGKKGSTIKDVINSMNNLDNLEVVTTDLFSGYKNDVYELFGFNDKVKVVADKFHVIQNLNKKVVKVRKAIVENHKGVKLGNNANLMKMNLENLTNDQKDELNNHFALIPDLAILYGLKESFRSIYSCKTKEKAKEIFERWCDQIPDKKEFDQLRKFKATIKQWEIEVFNWFDYRYTNAATEAVNGLIKKVNSNGRGYEFDTLRYKLLYGLTANYLPTETVFVSRHSTPSKQIEYKYVSPESMNLFTQKIRLLDYKKEDLTVKINDLIRAIDDKNIYLGEEDLLDNWWEDQDDGYEKEED